MKMIRKVTAAMVCIIIGTLISKGQQDPMYTQYIFNLQTINPAYAGSWQSLGLVGLSRHQWVGINGHPSTQTFSLQSPLKSQNVGVGLNIIHDKVGLERKVSIHFDYAYRVYLTDNTTLRFGIKGGFTNYSHNLLDYEQYPDDLSDPLFQSNIENQFMPNVGVGLYLSSEKYYLSLSLPKIVENSYKSNVTNYSTKSELRHLFFSGGMLFNLSDFVKLKPTVMTQAVSGSPLMYDISANVLLAEKLWLGAMYRSGDALAASAQWIVNKNLRIGYAADFTTSDLKNYQHGVHEVMISYEFNNSKRNYTSPRYF